MHGPLAANFSSAPANTVVFCTTCKGRAPHLQQTLPQNLADNKHARFVLVDYNSQDNLIDYLKRNQMEAIESGRLSVYSFKHAETFRMSHAKNMAHRLGILEGGDILVNLDADNFTGPDFDKYLLDQFQSCRDEMFLWARMIHHGGEAPRCAVPHRGDRCALPCGHEGGHSTFLLRRGISGRISVRAQSFLKVGGYDEKYETYSPDDRDFNFRLQRLGCVGRETDNHYLRTIMHNDKIRFREYRHAQFMVGEDDFNITLEGSDKTVANHGKVGMGTVLKNFTFDPVHLRAIPTRIFGIGLHKTATTSLHTALVTLGYDSAHWINPGWAKTVWLEMRDGRSKALEKYYAISDLPVALLYQQLDKSYPGSKFILTVRDEQRWLMSVRNHWDYNRNEFRASWDSDPFTHRLHREIYGQKHFNAEIFLARYRRHNAEVLEYFKDRPGDLLVMDMDRYAGWKELCGFLNRPVPACAYPVTFATAIAA